MARMKVEKSPETPTHSFKVDDLVTYRANKETHLPMTDGKEYPVVDVDDRGVFIMADDGNVYYYEPSHFTMSMNTRPTMDTIRVGQVVKIIQAKYGWNEFVLPNSLGIVTVVDKKQKVILIDMGYGKDFMADINDVVTGRGFGIEAVTPEDIAIRNKANIVTANLIKTVKNCKDLYAIECDRVSVKIQELQGIIRKETEDYCKIDALRRANFTKMLTPATQSNMTNHFMSLLRNCYDDIQVSGLCVKATTKPIVIKFKPKGVDDHTGIFEVGRYHVFLNNTLTIQILNEEPAKYIREGIYNHPHVRDSVPCWGTYSSEIATLRSDYRIPEMLQATHRFLSNCEPSGWYKPVLLWSSDWSDRCHSCFRLASNCRCHIETSPECGACGNPLDNCDCLHCTVSGEIIGEYDEYCETECSHWSWYNSENHNEGGECNG